MEGDELSESKVLLPYVRLECGSADVLATSVATEAIASFMVIEWTIVIRQTI